ncbi:MAG: DegT/DnrJ/EryC1/StrS family aminotransferase [Candidatus Anammoximicrobium sp.]|nr:DegT/DnrJ/EryC1/StrS family aminotransferase [Candidatus Anammoximicrobium sp.]
MTDRVTRRRFIQTTAAGSAALAGLSAGQAPTVFAAEADKPALLGGKPAHQGGWPKWPRWDEAWEPEIVQVLRSGQWCGYGGSGKVGEFEAAYAKVLGAKRCVTTSNGTNALITALHVMGVDAGDEVIISPFTFIATYNTVLMHKALPVLADTDPATLTMDPASIESRITERTRAIVPVHIYGMPCDMDPIKAIAKKHNLAVIEDACQAWLADYKGQKCGTLGDLACFSFQNSKHIPVGDGGAITSNSDELMDRCQAFHNVGRATGTFKGSGSFTRGTNCRMNNYQAAMLLPQIDKLVKETKTRQENGDYLIAGLKEIPGIEPVRLPENSRAVWHLFAFRYDATQFHGLSRDKFRQAMSAEGIPCSGGYSEFYYDGFLDEAINSRGFQRLFPAQRLKAYRESFEELKGNKQVVQTTVGLFNTLLLADRSAMDHILAAVRKIQAHSAALVA